MTYNEIVLVAALVMAIITVFSQSRLIRKQRGLIEAYEFSNNVQNLIITLYSEEFKAMQTAEDEADEDTELVPVKQDAA